MNTLIAIQQRYDNNQQQLIQEQQSMAFVNEKISEQDWEWVAKLVNYECIKAISRWIHKFHIPSFWTVDRERNAFLIQLGGGGSPDDIGRMPYAVLILDGQVIVFNVVRRGTGDGTVGRHVIDEVHELIVPSVLELRREGIKQLLREALEEDTYCRPFADGGTVADPNMTARSNVKSFSVEFK
ncbi:MAG: hypothetical protein IPH08_00100 [Rhodocyclaceae bacterium]|nr:hypothetical protein [Rhodocyclaceae bacterium]MBK6905584.1 hypothetical protein [Rhodocyclaceae bacterium]